ncbi:MAG: DUF1998 domain-containing protein, partial [Chloroflexi bacterium]|nr:DUF1998 domain-containing protein [Chloroflexota bacterium]
HVANLLRRLRRVCEFYGSHPTFICCSATIANPQELAQQLLGRPVKLVDQDGSPRGDKHVILYNPPLVDRSKGIRRSLVLEAATVADFFLSRDLPTIVFSRGRLSTELLLTYLRQSQRKMGLPSGRIRGYRGGYLPRERRAIERGLHEGRVRGVVSTNALELGVDIGDLSVCVLAGYPGTISSTWQQAGRAGRRQDVSAVVLVGGPLALDQYLLSHPDFLFGQTVERALLAPDNVHLLRSHLKCAAFELPVADDEVLAHSADWQSRLRSAAERDWHDLLQQLAEDEQVIRHSEGRWYWMSSQYPAQKMSLRTAAGDRFAICVEDGRVIGEMDSASVPLLLYPGAVYWHEGQAYLVTELSWEERLTRVRPAEVDYFTQASLSVQVEVLRQSQAGTPSRASGVGSQAGVSWAHGDVRLLTRPIGYKQISLYTHEQLASFPLDLPERELLTTAYWLYLEPNLVTALRDLGDWTIAPLLSYGPNWEVQRRRARERDGYRCCNCGRPESPGREHDVHHLQPFRTFDYRPGHNTAYIAANALSNLITLCPTCHPKVESLHIVQGTLDGLAHLLGALAPLYLMCDPQDLGVTWDLDLRHTRAPSIVLYDAVPGGVGFSAALYALHEELLQAALEWVSHCACEEGCPACIGAPAEIGAGAKRRVQQLLQQAVGGG